MLPDDVHPAELSRNLASALNTYDASQLWLADLCIAVAFLALALCLVPLVRGSQGKRPLWLWATMVFLCLGGLDHLLLALGTPAARPGWYLLVYAGLAATLTVTAIRCLPAQFAPSAGSTPQAGLGFVLN